MSRSRKRPLNYLWVLHGAGRGSRAQLGCISDYCGGGWRLASSPLSAREQRPHSAHICRGRRGERGARLKRAAHTVDWRRHQTRYSKALVVAICFTIRYYFQRGGRACFAEFTPGSYFLPMMIIPYVWLTFNIIPFVASRVLVFF